METNSTRRNKLLTPDEVAQFLSVSKATLYRLVNKRQFRFYKVAGVLRFKQDDLDDYLGKVCIEPIKKYT